MKILPRAFPALGLLTMSALLLAASAEDSAFAAKAAQAGNAEVAAGEIAKAKASDPRVKQFAETMVKDHSAAGSALGAAASKSSIALPSGVSVEQKAATERLATFSGAEFDRNYMDQMVKDHTEAVALFEKEAATGEDARLKAFAQQTLPTIKMHLEMAEKLAAKGK